MDSNPVSDSKHQVPAYLSVHVDMSERIKHFNWSQTSIGAADKWKQSLQHGGIAAFIPKQNQMIRQ